MWRYSPVWKHQLEAGVNNKEGDKLDGGREGGGRKGRRDVPYK